MKLIHTPVRSSTVEDILRGHIAKARTRAALKKISRKQQRARERQFMSCEVLPASLEELQEMARERQELLAQASAPKGKHRKHRKHSAFKTPAVDDRFATTMFAGRSVKVIDVGNPNQPREDDYRVIASCASDRVYA